MTQDQARLRDLALLRRVRDRIDREYAQPLDVGYENMGWITVGPPDQPDTAIVLHPPAVKRPGWMSCRSRSTRTTDSATVPCGVRRAT